MTKQVPWNKIILEKFVELGGLTKDEEIIIRTRISGWTVRQQANELGYSEANVHKMIARIKAKYDLAQKYDPLLPPRKKSAKETFLDEN